MNTVLSRLNAVFAFTLTVLGALTFGCFLSTAFMDYSLRNVQIGIAGRAQVKRLADFSTGDRAKKDLGILSFDLQADLTPLFDWNVKQLFVYLTAQYTTPKHEVNEVVLWDTIIKRADVLPFLDSPASDDDTASDALSKRRPGNPASLELRGSHTKYYMWDEGNGLVGNPNVTLVLSWNIVPHAGRLRDARGNGPHAVTFPAEYSAEGEARDMRGQRIHLRPPEA
jgi:signal peptidase complex subunit 3